MYWEILPLGQYFLISGRISGTHPCAENIFFKTMTVVNNYLKNYFQVYYDETGTRYSSKIIVCMFDDYFGILEYNFGILEYNFGILCRILFSYSKILYCLLC